MEYKHVRITDSVTMPVPIGLTPDEEAYYIASRIAFVDFEALEAECRDLLRQHEAGELIPLRNALAELEQEMASPM